MRLLILSLLICLLNCEDKKTTDKKSLDPPISKVIKDTIVTVEKPKVPEREFPVLNDKNAMEFFLEYDKEHKENKVRITTDFGIIDIQLFNKTKFHRSNFIFLTKLGYFDNTQFYRIVNNFIIQGGNSDNPDIRDKRRNIGKYLLPPDTKRGYRHHRGVVSMPSSEIKNPHKLASPFEFFIVQSPNGAYHLDGDYTIFGKVIKGMNVVDEIAKQKADGRGWPDHNIYIRKVEIID
ncbi:MAG: peptidylprolyl isomerase [Bacteroidia bacterium]|nr:peptidylprolyl isomerase [Bacteroidia bacterium]NND09971.1 peptidylprolyl isomerase [Flavobacteriaceae bacterium]NNK27901.1 peptidylprolyl isomerase [Flavobacteriaceae bacterium]